jgi:peptide/nickel transport system ATP-binding protein
MKEKLLEVKNLNVEYHSDSYVFHAVNGISFDLGCQETIGLVGETGAGKTTTALAIMQLLSERTSRVNSGEIIFKGENILARSREEMQELRGAKISMIFQDPMTCLNPLMTVGDQIREVLEIHAGHLELGDGKKQIEDRVDQLFELVGIPPVRGKDFPNQFSGGMKQRVMIAMALACNPELLIADEPTTALDVTIQAQVLNLMADLKKTINTSMIMISHDLGVVVKTCDKVAIMYAGEIVEIGPVEDIYGDKEHHPYTEGLFGAIPDIYTKVSRLNAIDGLMPDPTNLPQGCKFAPRCKHCMDICKVKPPGTWVQGEHKISCHLYAKEVE